MYDVEFLDGTCVAVYGNCDFLSPASFAGFEELDNAFTILLDILLMSGMEGDYPANIAAMRGLSEVF